MLSPDELYPAVLGWVHALAIAPVGPGEASVANLVTALLSGQSAAECGTGTSASERADGPRAPTVQACGACFDPSLAHVGAHDGAVGPGSTRPRGRSGAAPGDGHGAVWCVGDHHGRGGLARSDPAGGLGGVALPVAERAVHPDRAPAAPASRCVLAAGSAAPSGGGSWVSQPEAVSVPEAVGLGLDHPPACQAQRWDRWRGAQAARPDPGESPGPVDLSSQHLWHRTPACGRPVGDWTRGCSARAPAASGEPWQSDPAAPPADPPPARGPQQASRSHDHAGPADRRLGRPLHQPHRLAAGLHQLHHPLAHRRELSRRPEWVRRAARLATRGGGHPPHRCGPRRLPLRPLGGRHPPPDLDRSPGGAGHAAPTRPGCPRPVDHLQPPQRLDARTLRPHRPLRPPPFLVAPLTRRWRSTPARRPLPRPRTYWCTRHDIFVTTPTPAHSYGVGG